jgi:competence protein ComEA
MRKSLHIITLALVIAAVSTAAFADAAPSAVSSGVVNINSADATQLSLLPRVGAKAAERIIAYRTEHGPFKKTSDLMQVKGIGAKTYERMAQYLSVDGKTTLSAKVQSPRKPRAKKPATTASN